MQVLGTGINLLVGLIIIGYIIYTSYIFDENARIPHFILEIALHPLGRFIFLVIIVMISLGHKIYGIGGPTLGLLGAIAYLLTLFHVNNGNIEKFGVNQVVGSPQCGNYQSDMVNFNPEPHRPNDSALASGAPDPIPEEGQDFRSSPPGVFADSGVAYDFNMS